MPAPKVLGQSGALDLGLRGTAAPVNTSKPIKTTVRMDHLEGGDEWAATHGTKTDVTDVNQLG